MLSSARPTGGFSDRGLDCTQRGLAVVVLEVQPWVEGRKTDKEGLTAGLAKAIRGQKPRILYIVGGKVVRREMKKC